MADDDLIKDFLDEAGTRMAKSVEATRNELATVRTGRASPHLLDRIQVDYYGAVTPLKQLSQVSASEARLLTVTPSDKNSIKQIEKAIMESDVGLTPNSRPVEITAGPEDLAYLQAHFGELPRWAQDAYRLKFPELRRL